MTTRRFFAPPAAFFAGAADLAGAEAFGAFWPSVGAGVLAGGAVAALGAAFGLAWVAVAAPPSPFAPAIAFSASDSSTLDAAALASTPAAFNAASSSLLLTPWALAISWTRFFATRPAQPPRAPVRPRRPGL